MLKIAPIPMIGVVLSLLLLLDLSALHYLGQLPDPGGTLSTDGVVVLWDDVPLHKLVGSAGGISLYPEDLMEEPDVLPDKQAMRDFFDRQSRILQVLESGEVSAETAGGKVAVTVTKESVPPAGFWIQLLVGNIGLLVGVAVWTFQRSNIAARHLAVTGVGLAAASMSAAVYSARPIAMPGDIFSALSQVNHAGTHIFCAGFLCMMWNYPRSMTKFSIAPFWYAAMLVVIGLDVFNLVESTHLTRRASAVVTLLLAILVLIWQWRQSSVEPLARQSLLWFVSVTLSGSALFVGMIFIPPLVGGVAPVSQAAAFLAFLTIYLGLAVGVARYPLFDLQQYWVKSLIWWAGGLGVIVINLLIVRYFGLSTETALGMIIVSLAALVLPLRAVGAHYVFNRASNNFQSHLPQIVARMSRSSERDAGRIWHEQILEIFQPLEVSRENIQVVKPTVVKGGLGFVIPAIEGGASYHLMYADQGTRLFSSLDVTLVDTLSGLFELNLSASKRAEEATHAERGRLRKDLHDTLGGRLLSILHSSSDGRVADESRQAIGELREILAGVDSEPTTLEDALQKWQVQLAAQCESMNARLVWKVSGDLVPSSIALQGPDRFNIGQILREAVTNGLKHASANRIEVTVTNRNNELGIEVRNNIDVHKKGQIIDPADWSSGIGRRNIQERAGELQARVRWQIVEGEILFSLQLPLAAGARFQ